MKHSTTCLIAILLLAAVTATAEAQQLPMFKPKPAPWIPALQKCISQIEQNNTPDTADLLIAEAEKHLGAPYRYGGKGPKAFDCAGFARFVYMKFGYRLPGGSGPQYKQGRHIKDPRRLQRGDLVFWQGRSGGGGVGHTGIVCEVDTVTGVFRFIHAATSSGVIHSYSSEPYYSSRYIGGTRLLGDRKKPHEPLPAKRKKAKHKKRS